MARQKIIIKPSAIDVARITCGEDIMELNIHIPCPIKQFMRALKAKSKYNIQQLIIFIKVSIIICSIKLVELTNINNNA